MADISLKILQNSELVTMIIVIAIIFGLLKLLTRYKVTKDNFFIIFLTIAYAFLTFYDLGTSKLATSTFDAIKNDQEIILKVDGAYNKIYAISGIGDNNSNHGTYQIYYHDIEIYTGDTLNGEYTYLTTLDEEEFYKYQIIDVGYIDDPYIKLVFPSRNGVLSEFWLVNDEDVQNIEVISDSASDDLTNAYKIIDEQDTIALDPSYMDETYFDEIYHARNAYEIASGQKMYTAVHPLLGTEIIALGTKIFGFNTFGFRFMGALFSVLLIPLIYLLSREFFKKKWSYLVALLFAFDFMHYTTGRIATLEPFSIFFIVLMFYLMIKALKYDYTKDTKKSFKWLALSGIAMGLAISTKWTGIYGALGLAIIYFIFNIKYLLKAKKENRPVLKKTFYLFLWSVLFFIIIPLIIYTASFILVPMYADKWTNISEFIDQVIRYNTYMFEYHTGLESTHPYSSEWYQWLFDIRPIWYYVKRGNDYIQTISCFNDPIISIAGFIAMVCALYKIIKVRDTKLMTLVIMYLSLLLPWVFVTRTSFSYHYYPCIPFLIMTLVYVLYDVYRNLKPEHLKIFKRCLYGFVIISGLLFILFLPIIGGFKTSYIYVKILRWLPSWYFG